MRQIDLSLIRSERRRGFQPPWYTVYVYRCYCCGKEKIIFGKNPEPGADAIQCPHCKGPT